jgi:2,3-diketo-5-methylthio-1-phosphopentane phosphatase
MSDRPPAFLPAAAPAQGAPGWIVQCDFDGTISVEDVTDTLLQRFGRPGWQALEEAWLRGDIGSRECMKGQVALLEMTEVELQSHLDAMAIDPQFPAFVSAAQRLGVEVQVVSDGLDRAIHHILARHGLHRLPVFANRLLPHAPYGPRAWQLQSPLADRLCLRASGNCKCALATAQQAAQRKVLYVGDGASDFCVAGRADLVLAKSRLIAHCEAHAIAHRPFEHFGQAQAWLTQLCATEGVRT